MLYSSVQAATSRALSRLHIQLFFLDKKFQGGGLRVVAPLLYRSQDIEGFFCSGIFPASEYLFSATQGLKKSVILTRFCSINLAISSACADSPNFYDLRLLRVPVQGVNILVVFGEIVIDIKSNAILSSRQKITSSDSIRHLCRVSSIKCCQ